MRMILAFLALAQSRLAMLDVERSRLLGWRSDEALTRGQERMQQAYALVTRAQTPATDPWATVISGFTAIAFAFVALAVVVALLLVGAFLSR